MRRGKPRKNALNKFSVMLNNVRGYRTKEVMIKRIIDEEEPVMIPGVYRGTLCHKWTETLTEVEYYLHTNKA